MSDSVILWTVAHQAPLTMGFSRENTGVAFHALLQGIFPTEGANLYLLMSPALASMFFTTSANQETPL